MSHDRNQGRGKSVGVSGDCGMAGGDLPGMRALLELIPLPTYTCDPDGLITYYNAQAVELWGRQPKLRDAADRFCGSFKLFSATGEPILQEDCWMARAIREGRSFNDCEVLIERPDGVRLRVLANANPLRDEQGRVCGAVNVLVNLTARHEAQQAAITSQRRYMDLLNHLDGIVWEADARTLEFRFVSQQARRILGYPVSDWLKVKDFWQSHIHTEDRDQTIRFCASATERGEDHQFEYRMIAADGRVVWLHDTVSLEVVDGKAVTMRGVMVDITERKQAERALRESEERYRALFEGAPDAMFVLGTEGEQMGRIIAANTRAAESHGYTLDEMLGRPITFLDTPAHAPDLPGRIQRLLHGERLNFEVEHVRKDGSIFPVEVTAQRIMLDGRPHILAFDRDITERRKAQQALLQSQENLRLAVESANLGLWDWDLLRNKVVYSPEWKRQLGYEPHELTDDFKEWETRVHPADIDRTRAMIEDHLSGRTARYVVEFRLRHRDGSWRWIHVRGAAIRNEQGQAVRMLGCHVDVTEHKRIENALRQSEERLRAVIANAPGVAIQWFDRLGRIKLWNDASEAMFGYSAQEAIGRTLDQLIHTPQETERFLELLGSIARTGHPAGPMEVEFRRRDGMRRTCLSSIFRIPGEGEGDWFVCMDVDITDRKVAEEQRRLIEAQMQHAQKLESLGVMAGGIAHDFNNLLTPILGRAALALKKLPADSPVKPLIKEIESAARRSADLTQQMLAYTGKANLTVAPVRLDLLVQEMAQLLRTVVSKRAMVGLELKPVTVQGDATQIRQVVMNLITNASDALGDQNGIIRIRCGERHFTSDDLQSKLNSTPLSQGRYAFIEVEDTGSGISSDNLERIFEPFFTTKFTGRGLGLAATLGVVRSHHGGIRVHSTQGKGTRVTIILPSCDQEKGPTKEALADPAGSTDTDTNACILIIEDEPLVRSYAEHVIAEAGYTVVTANDGEEGLEQLRTLEGQVAAVLLDLTMPRLDGHEVLQEIRRRAPQLPVIIMSGYSKTDTRVRQADLAANAFIQKPFTPDELLNTLSRLLHA